MNRLEDVDLCLMLNRISDIKDKLEGLQDERRKVGVKVNFGKTK